MCITGKDWAGIWREWPRSSLLLSLLGDLMNPLYQLLECSPTLWSGSLISHFGQFARVLTHGCQILEGTSVFETRAVFDDSFHFINKTCIWAHTFTKNWTLLDDLFNRQRIGTLQVKRENKVELKTRIFTKSRYTTAQVNQLGTSWRALQPSKNMDTAGSSGYKVELETRIFTGNRYTTARINQPWASHNFLYFRL